MDQTVKLSVIIPCFNGAATLATQLEALVSQSWSEPWEIIVADNASTDNSVEVAQKFIGKFPALQIVKVGHSKRLASFARNMGVKAANAPLLAFCDADDEVDSEWVSAMGNALLENNVVCGKFQFDKFNESGIAKRSADVWKNGLYQGRFLPGGGSGNFGIQKWLHVAIGGFDECLPHAEDADYFWRLQLEGFRLHYEPKAMIQIRIGRINPTLSSLYHRSRNRFASNYWCYKRYKNLGMLPPPSIRESLVKWIHLLRQVAKMQNQSMAQKIRWRQTLAQYTGELIGQFHGRLTNPCSSYHPGSLKGLS